jgi:hypothetical protein
MKYPNPHADSDALNVLLTAARYDERRGRAQAVADRLAAMATHIGRKGLSGVEAAELLRYEAQRYRDESQELR